MKLLKEHYALKANPMVEWCRFYNRIKQQNEAVAVFPAELCTLIDTCDFGSQLNTRLRDRLIVGINNTHRQRCLLAEPYCDHTLEMVRDLCIAVEAVTKNVQLLHETQGRLATATINTAPSVKTNKEMKMFQANKAA